MSGGQGRLKPSPVSFFVAYEWAYCGKGRNAIQSAICSTGMAFSRPSGISESPEPENCAMSRRSTVSVTPSARLSVGRRLRGCQELCREIERFFKTRKVPVSADETIEIFAFMEAADLSKRQGGAAVSLTSVLAKAKSEAAAKLEK